MTSLYNPRFKSDEHVRIRRDVLNPDGSVKLAAGTICKVSLRLVDTGDQTVYALRPLLDDSRHDLEEAELEYVGRSSFLAAPKAGQLVTGRIERIVLQTGCPGNALVLLDGIPGMFRIQVLNLTEEAILRLTQPKDKVEFVVTQTGPVSDANAFRNLSLALA